MPSIEIKTKSWGKAVVTGKRSLIESVSELELQKTALKKRSYQERGGGRKKRTVNERVLRIATKLSGEWSPLQMMKASKIGRPSVMKALFDLTGEKKIKKVRRGYYQLA